jgi:hypothetical protein
MKISKINSRNLLYATLLLAAVLLQNCKKGVVNAPVAGPPKQGMYALVNDTAWTAEILSASLEYNAANTGITFNCEGTMGNQMIQLTAFQSNEAASNYFPVGATAGNLSNFAYYILPIHRSLTEQNVTRGTTAGSSMVITAIDSAKRLISGTFMFPSPDSTYDAIGNLILVHTNHITKGVFKLVPYVYKP